MAGTSERHLEGGLWRELLKTGVYKRSQGRVSRQLTFAALAGTLAVAVWRLSQFLPVWLAAPGGQSPDIGVVRFLVPGLLLAAGTWLCFRIVNVPRFADFLIAVESEMAKVSWPTLDQVIRSSVVIIFLMFALAGILAAYDLFWWFVLRSLQGTG
jgi:preprotein translocase subunit SecE